MVEAVELEGALAQVFEDAPRGADHDVRAMLQRADLRAERHAAAQGQHLDVVGAARQQADFLGHLVGQFAGRAQHQRLAAEVALIERRQQAEGEGGGLAAAGLGLGDQVVTGEDQWQALRLDRCHLPVANGVQTGKKAGGQWQGGEGVGHGVGSV
ncbi:hypothetical protein D3C78_1238910 [compost metagenome]